VLLRTLARKNQLATKGRPAASGLNHPNICTIHDIGDGQAFIAMEFLAGATLRQRINGKPIETFLDLAIDVSRPGGRACKWDYPSRHQAGEHFCYRTRLRKDP
jgi:hypothetical protein